MNILFTFIIILVIVLLPTESAVARLGVQLGKPAIFDFGKNMFVIKRTTPANENPQYLFAAKNQDGFWTTDGKDKIGSHSKLFWNGTLIIDKITADDVGTYEAPMQIPNPHFARNIIIFELI